MSTGDINTLTSPVLRDFAHSLILKLQAIGAIAQNNRQGWVSFVATQSLYKAKVIASIRFYPDHIRLHAHNIDADGSLNDKESYPYVDIFIGNENVIEIMAMIHRSYRRLVGE